MNYPHFSVLSKEAVKEFGALLLLDHLMQYELLQIEKVELEDIIDQIEKGVEELKKVFQRNLHLLNRQVQVLQLMGMLRSLP